MKKIIAVVLALITMLSLFSTVIAFGADEPYIKSITPVKNIPTYIYEGSESAFLDETEFKIVYVDGTSKTVSLVKAYSDEKAHYTIDGEELIYDTNHQTQRIYIAYFDASNYIEVAEVREYPFESLKLVECELDGDMPVKITYEILRKGETQAQRYVKEVNGYSGYMDYIDGYPVAYSTEGSDYVSTVEVRVGDTLKASKTYEMQQQSFFQKLIAKIILFFKTIFAMGIF